MRHALVITLLIAGVLGMRAQEESEYRMEIGGGIGLVNYLGDYNGNLAKNLHADLIETHRQKLEEQYAQNRAAANAP